MNDYNFIAQQGWQCPICKTVYSPSTPMCVYCGGGMTKTSTSTNGTIGTIDVDWLKQQSTTYTSVCTGTCYGRDTFSSEDMRGDDNA